MADDIFDYWFPWYPARYQKRTMKLDPYQDGVYRRLIDHYMVTRSPLENDDAALARIAGISLSDFTPHSKIIRSYFQVKKGHLFHPTCDGILRDQEEFSKKRTESAKKAGKASAEKKQQKQGQSNGTLNERSTDVQRKSTTGQDRTIQDSTGKRESSSTEPVVLKTHTDYPPFEKTGVCVFEEFWKARPGRGGASDSEDAAQKEFLTLTDSDGIQPDVLLKAMQAYATEARANSVAGTRYAKSAAGFLRDGHWRQYAGLQPSPAAAEPSAPATPLPEWLQPMTQFHDDGSLRRWFKDVTFEDGKFIAPSKFIADRIRQEFAQGLSRCYTPVEIIVKQPTKEMH